MLECSEVLLLVNVAPGSLDLHSYCDCTLVITSRPVLLLLLPDLGSTHSYCVS